MIPHSADVDAAFLDAVAGVRSAAPADFPNGLVAINDWIGGHAMAAVIGPGEELAAEYRRRGHAFLYDAKLFAETGDRLRVLVDRVACHEVAHMVTTNQRARGVAARLDGLATERPGTEDAFAAARRHPPAWAGAFHILAERLQKYRPYRDDLARSVERCLRRHGYLRQELARVCRGHDENRPLRELLEVGSVAASLLELMLPTVDQRAARMVAEGTYSYGIPTGVAG
jgi:hypothetical protein